MASSLVERMEQLGKAARAAAAILAGSPTQQRDGALVAAAAQLRTRQHEILAVNRLEVERGAANGLDRARLDRLLLSAPRLEAMARAMEEVATLPDPLGQVLASWQRPNGLQIERVSVPLGVIGVIFESRPNVASDAGCLCLKAGNAAILRSGSDCFASAHVILSCLQQGLAAVGLPPHAVQDLGSSEREAVDVMIKQDRYIDVLVPRGGRALVEHIRAHSSIPTFCHLDGICHTYIHAEADLEMSWQVLLNAKMRRPGVCGATETLLLDRAVLHWLPRLADPLLAAGCELRGDEEACTCDPRLVPASEQDWDSEYLAPILSIRVVGGLQEALAHIARHGSQHTEAIITQNRTVAESFLAQVDAAIVMHNVSTQFADGGEFGMGMEIGIATGRMHARGPVGAQQLTSFNYRVRGSGQCRPL